MKKTLDCTITRDNIAQRWTQIDTLRRKSKVKAAVSEFCCFWSNLFLLLCTVLGINGVLYQTSQGPYREFLKSITFFTDLWEPFSQTLFLPEDDLTRMCVKTLLAIYALSVVFFLLLALLVMLVYHPRKKKMCEGSYAEQTQQLAIIAQEARSHGYKTRLTTSLGATILVIAACFVLVFFYTFRLEDPMAIAMLLSQFPTPDMMTNCVLYVLIGYFISYFLTTPLLLITRCIYRYEVPFEWVVQADFAAFCAAEETADIPPEELPAHLLTKGAALREEALDLEKQEAYGSAKLLLHKAALFGDIPAMEHFARHCLIQHMHDSARYWLEKACAVESPSPTAKKMLLRLKLGLYHRVEYLRPESAPLTGFAKVWSITKRTLSILFRILMFALFLTFLYTMVQYFRSGANPETFNWIFDLFSGISGQ